MPRPGWEPPPLYLIGLTLFVTLVAAVAVSFASAQLAVYASEHGTLHPALAGLWLLYATVLVTGVKATRDWVLEQKSPARH